MPTSTDGVPWTFESQWFVCLFVCCLLLHVPPPVPPESSSNHATPWAKLNGAVSAELDVPCLPATIPYHFAINFCGAFGMNATVDNFQVGMAAARRCRSPSKYILVWPPNVLSCVLTLVRHGI